MLRRMIQAAQLKPALFEEVESDRGAMGQALLVVAIVAVCTGIGAMQVSGAGAAAIAYGVVGAIVAWAVWAGITYFVGTTIFKTPTTHGDWGQLARALGFAQSPGVLAILGVVPRIGDIIFLTVFLWQLVAMVVAVRQALDYDSTLRAIGVVMVGAIPYFLFRVFLALLLPGEA